MADTTFTAKVTKIAATWLQDVNDFVYKGVGLVASLITYTPAGTGAVATTAQAKFRQDLPSVFDKMTAAEIADVVSNTGSIDVTAKFVLAQTDFLHFKVPAGTYVLDNYKIKDKETWETEGYFGTIIKQGAAGNPAIIFDAANGSNVIGAKINKIGIIGHASATVPAVEINTSGSNTVTACEFDAYIQDTYQALVLTGGTLIYNNKIKVISNNTTTTTAYEFAVQGGGSYNHYDIFLTQCNNGYAFSAAGIDEIYDRIVTDGYISIGGGGNVILSPTVEGIYSSTPLPGAAILDSGGGNTWINPSLIGIANAKAGYGFIANNNAIIINFKTQDDGNGYPNYPLIVGAGSTVIGGKSAGGFKLEQYHSASVLMQIKLINIDSSLSLIPPSGIAPPHDLGTATTYTIDAGVASFGLDDVLYLGGGTGLTVTFPTGAEYSGRKITIMNRTTNAIISASSNIVGLTGSTGTGLVAATSGKWVTVQANADASLWIIVAGN